MILILRLRECFCLAVAAIILYPSSVVVSAFHPLSPAFHSIPASSKKWIRPTNSPFEIHTAPQNGPAGIADTIPRRHCQPTRLFLGNNDKEGKERFRAIVEFGTDKGFLLFCCLLVLTPAGSVYRYLFLIAFTGIELVRDVQAGQPPKEAVTKAILLATLYGWAIFSHVK